MGDGNQIKLNAEETHKIGVPLHPKEMKCQLHASATLSLGERVRDMLCRGRRQGSGLKASLTRKGVNEVL
jgi:hypothetical protein